MSCGHVHNLCAHQVVSRKTNLLRWPVWKWQNLMLNEGFAWDIFSLPFLHRAPKFTFFFSESLLAHIECRYACVNPRRWFFQYHVESAHDILNVEFSDIKNIGHKNKQRSNYSSTNPSDYTFYIPEFSFLVIPSIYLHLL
jgi:hypothetical protein